MATTTIRVDLDTRDRLRAIAERQGRTLTEVTRDAVKELERREFARRAIEDVARLKADPEAWADYMAEADSLT